MIVESDRGTDGYLSGIGYLRWYCPQLNPLRMRIALVEAGLRPPVIEAACELGFGQGISLAVHAAASRTTWYGTDLNPAHAEFARTLAAGPPGGADQIYADSIAEFDLRRDLPDFDFIGLHGVWSWVSEDNRARIVAFIRRRLKPGGVVYLGHNVLPGWAPFEPMRHLAALHAGPIGENEAEASLRVGNTVRFMQELLGTLPGYTQDHPTVGQRFADDVRLDWRYVAHEYLNRDWHPMHFSDVASALAGAGLSHACLSDPLANFEGLSLTRKQQDLARDISDPILRETIRDFIVNRQFRRDYWVRSPQQLSPRERDECLRGQRVVLCGRRAELPTKVRALLALNGVGPGEAALEVLLDALADHRPRTLGELEGSSTGLSLAQVAEGVALLRGYTRLTVAQPEAIARDVANRTARLNARLIGLASEGEAADVLASPITGGGIPLTRSQQLFLQARQAGRMEPDDWALHALPFLENGRHATEGEAASSLGELQSQARTFAATELPILESLQVVQRI